jgi:FkbM family methyltransferase
MKKPIRSTPIPAKCQNKIISSLILFLLKCSDYPTRLRQVTALRKIGGELKRLTVKTRYGFCMALDDLDYIQRTIQNEGVWESELTNLFNIHLRETDTFFDIGANVGYFSLFGACVKKCKVVAFDPDPLNCDLIRLNAELNNVRINIIQKAVSAEPGTLKFFRNDAHNSGQSGMNSPAPVAEFSVASTPIDQFVKENPELMPDVIKMDVEGHEDEVINGMLELLRFKPPRIIVFESNPNPSDKVKFEAIERILLQNKYNISRVESRDDLDCYNWISILS